MLYDPLSEEGQGLVEYALLLVLIVAVVLLAVVALGPLVANMYSKIVNDFPSPP
jgi:pilus assembly protein Flp/PilA